MPRTAGWSVKAVIVNDLYSPRVAVSLSGRGSVAREGSRPEERRRRHRLHSRETGPVRDAPDKHMSLRKAQS
jgi:hypothetical protein